MSFPNENFLRNLANDTPLSEIGYKLVEALRSLQSDTQNVTQQVNGNTKGQPAAPPAIDAVTVAQNNGFFNIAIAHQSPLYRGVQYHAEFADNAKFTNPQPIDMGSSRMHTMYLGAGAYYFRAAASYGISAPGPWAYHGGTQPQVVTGSGTGKPVLQSSQGSGTGTPGQGLQGPGTIPYRSTNGKPPPR